MAQKIIIALLCFLSFRSFAHEPVAEKIVVDSTSHVRISILTCGIGDELYSSFGHTGIRVIDSLQKTDVVYNYGTFNFGDPHFYQKFMMGKLPYYIGEENFNDFMYTYVVEKRKVQEQVLNLSAEHKEAILAFLSNNMKPENRAYKYDFLWDNCCTRVRDILPRVLGPEFYYGDVLPNKKISFRNIIDRYLFNKHWERLGIDLLLGSRIDSTMTEESVMFLPDFLHGGLVHAKYRDRHIVLSESTLLNYKADQEPRLNGPLWTMIAVLIITVCSFLVRGLRRLKSVMRFILLFSTGLLGVLMLFMWLFTDNQGCYENYNILWALPLNAAVAFMAHKQKFWLRIYALVAISFLIAALIVHLIGFQQLPLIEIAPLLLALMYVYVDMYKRNLPAAINAPAH